MYREPVLEKFFFEQTLAASGIDLSNPPPIGDFDIGFVKDSEYFFC